MLRVSLSICDNVHKTKFQMALDCQESHHSENRDYLSLRKDSMRQTFKSTHLFSSLSTRQLFIQAKWTDKKLCNTQAVTLKGILDILQHEQVALIKRFDHFPLCSYSTFLDLLKHHCVFRWYRRWKKLDCSFPSACLCAWFLYLFDHSFPEQVFSLANKRWIEYYRQ